MEELDWASYMEEAFENVSNVIAETATAEESVDTLFSLAPLIVEKLKQEGLDVEEYEDIRVYVKYQTGSVVFGAGDMYHVYEVVLDNSAMDGFKLVHRDELAPDGAVDYYIEDTTKVVDEGIRFEDEEEEEDGYELKTLNAFAVWGYFAEQMKSKMKEDDVEETLIARQQLSLIVEDYFREAFPNGGTEHPYIPTLTPDLVLKMGNSRYMIIEIKLPIGDSIELQRSKAFSKYIAPLGRDARESISFMVYGLGVSKIEDLGKFIREETGMEMPLHLSGNLRLAEISWKELKADWVAFKERNMRELTEASEMSKSVKGEVKKFYSMCKSELARLENGWKNMGYDEPRRLSTDEYVRLLKERSEGTSATVVAKSALERNGEDVHALKKAIDNFMNKANKSTDKREVSYEHYKAPFIYPLYANKRAKMSKTEEAHYWAEIMRECSYNCRSSYLNHITEVTWIMHQRLIHEGDVLFDNKIILKPGEGAVMKKKGILESKRIKALGNEGPAYRQLTNGQMLIVPNNSAMESLNRRCHVQYKKSAAGRLDHYRNAVWKNWLMSKNPPGNVRVQRERKDYKYEEFNNIDTKISIETAKENAPSNTSFKGPFTRVQLSSIWKLKQTPIRVLPVDHYGTEWVQTVVENMFEYAQVSKQEVEDEIHSLIGNGMGKDAEIFSDLKELAVRRGKAILGEAVKRRMYWALKNMSTWAKDMLHLIPQHTGRNGCQFHFNGKDVMTIILEHQSTYNDDQSVPYILVWRKGQDEDFLYKDRNVSLSGVPVETTFSVRGVAYCVSKPMRTTARRLLEVSMIMEKVTANIIGGLTQQRKEKHEITDLKFHLCVRGIFLATQRQDLHMAMSYFRYIAQNAAASYSSNVGFIGSKLEVNCKSPVAVYMLMSMLRAASTYNEQMAESGLIDYSEETEEGTLYQQLMKIKLQSVFLNRVISYTQFVEEMFIYSGHNKDMLPKNVGFKKEVDEIVQMREGVRAAESDGTIGKHSHPNMWKNCDEGVRKTFNFSTGVCFTVGEIIKEEILLNDKNFSVESVNVFGRDLLSLSSSKASIMTDDYAKVFDVRNRGKVFDAVLVNREEHPRIIDYVNAISENQWFPVSIMDMKVQHGGKRHFHIMTLGTKIMALIGESVIESIAKKVKYETITKSAEKKAHDMNQIIMEMETYARERDLDCWKLSFDATKWAPSSHMYQYYCMIKGMRGLMNENIQTMMEWLMLRWMDGAVKTPESVMWTSVDENGYPFGPTLGRDVSFRMGIFGRLSSVFHVGAMLYGIKVAKKILINMGRKDAAESLRIEFRVSSDDSFVIICCVKERKILEVVMGAMEHVKQACGIKTQTKKSFASREFCEYNSIFFAGPEVMVPTTIQIASVFTGLTGRGYPSDVLSVAAKAAEMLRRGMTLEGSYLLQRLLCKWCARSYGIKGDMWDRPEAAMGLPDCLPVFGLLGGGMNLARIWRYGNRDDVLKVAGNMPILLNNEPLNKADIGSLSTHYPVITIKKKERGEKREKITEERVKRITGDKELDETQKILYTMWVPSRNMGVFALAYKEHIKNRAWKDSLSPKTAIDVLLRLAQSKKSRVYKFWDTVEGKKHTMSAQEYIEWFDSQQSRGGTISNEEEAGLYSAVAMSLNPPSRIGIDLFDEVRYNPRFARIPPLQAETKRFKTPLPLLAFAWAFGEPEAARMAFDVSRTQIKRDLSELKKYFGNRPMRDTIGGKTVEFRDILSKLIKLQKRVNTFLGPVSNSGNVVSFMCSVIKNDFRSGMRLNLTVDVRDYLTTPLGRELRVIGNRMIRVSKNIGALRLLIALCMWGYWYMGKRTDTLEFKKFIEDKGSMMVYTKGQEPTTLLKILMDSNSEDVSEMQLSERQALSIIKSVATLTAEPFFCKELKSFTIDYEIRQDRTITGLFDLDSLVVATGTFVKGNYRFSGNRTTHELVVNGMTPANAVTLAETLCNILRFPFGKPTPFNGGTTEGYRVIYSGSNPIWGKAVKTEGLIGYWWIKSDERLKKPTGVRTSLSVDNSMWELDEKCNVWASHRYNVKGLTFPGSYRMGFTPDVEYDESKNEIVGEQGIYLFDAIHIGFDSTIKGKRDLLDMETYVETPTTLSQTLKVYCKTGVLNNYNLLNGKTLISWMGDTRHQRAVASGSSQTEQYTSEGFMRAGWSQKNVRDPRSQLFPIHVTRELKNITERAYSPGLGDTREERLKKHLMRAIVIITGVANFSNGSNLNPLEMAYILFYILESGMYREGPFSNRIKGYVRVTDRQEIYRSSLNGREYPFKYKHPMINFPSDEYYSVVERVTMPEYDEMSVDHLRLLKESNEEYRDRRAIRTNAYTRFMKFRKSESLF